MTTVQHQEGIGCSLACRDKNDSAPGLETF